MKKRVGILTAGGDCPGLNATIRGVAKALYVRMGDNVEIIGILNGYHGLINGDYKKMEPDDFRGLLTLGGTILGTKRTPFKMMQVIEEDKIDKVAAMKKTYKDLKLDCLLCLGGNGTHKTANLLSQEGLNIIGLPKTIDNDIYGTDVTFGFHTAVEIATEVIDRIHTTAGSHSRVMCIEIMGNKAGWLTLYAGIAGGADIILLPELPYDIDRVCAAVERRAKNGSNFSIIAVAEGALNAEEARMKRKEWTAKRVEAGFGATATNRIAAAVQKKTGMETRVCIPGHMQRGGTPCAYDRVLSTQFGSHAALRRHRRHGERPGHREPSGGCGRQEPQHPRELRPPHRRPPDGHQPGLSCRGAACGRNSRGGLGAALQFSQGRSCGPQQKQGTATRGG